MRWCNSVIVIFLCIFTSNCISELSIERKEKIINGFLEYLNNLPGQVYTYNEGVLTDAQKLDENVFRIQASLKATDIHNLDSHKLFQCSATISDLGESGVSVQNNEHMCQDADSGTDVKTPSKTDETSSKLDDGTINEISSTEPTLDYQPIKLDNEIQTTAVTSGEQFIAIPREHPSVPCIGCSQHVNVQAIGVNDLAELAIKHLNKHDPNVRHILDSVVDVERQVQVVNGVRYVLTLIVDYNNCKSEETNACITKTPCKVSVLEKPWVKLPDGSKYRAILSNNCTAEWIYGDNGEVVDDNDKNKESNDIVINGNIQDAIDIDGARKPIPDYDKIANTGSADEILKAIHTIEVQAQPQPEKLLSEEQMKNLESQIIPHGQTLESASSTSVEKPMTEASDSIMQTVGNVETVKHYSGKPGPLDDKKKSIDLSDDKRKALEDLINFFDSAHVEPKLNLEQDLPRTRRSYDHDLKIMTLVDKFRRIKKKIDNAQYVYSLAQIMLDYINEMDMEIKTLVLRDVIAAEEEKENYQNFYYIKARAAIPCLNADCDQKHLRSKICNGVIEVSEKVTPQVLSAFCYDEQKEKYDIHSSKNVPTDDPLLIKLSEQALNDIELSSSHSNAMKITKIVEANTQKVSGILTKITMIIAYTDCKKTVPFKKRSKCHILEKIGSNICEVEIHERHWLKEKKIRHTCTERPIDESFSDIKHIETNEKVVADPKILEMVQEALQYLEIDSNRNNKQKVVDIKSVKTQILAGLLTYIDFLVGYTTCPNDFQVDINSCELIQTEPLRKCIAQVWDRPWLEDGRQVNVSCNDDVSNEIPRVLKKRSADVLVGGQQVTNPDDKKYRSLAEESLMKYLETSGNSKPHSVVRVEKVTVQVVAGKLTRIDFIVAPEVSDEESSKDIEIKCHSHIWEKSWIDFKEINVTCMDSKPKSRIARGAPIPGGQSEKDPSDARYKSLAEKSLKKFVQSSTGSQHFEVIRVNKVTTQVTSGLLTRIDFTISPTNCQLDNNQLPLQYNCLVQEHADEFTCHSQVWEQPWIPKEEITVRCDVTGSMAHHMQKRESSGKPKEEDSNNQSPKNIGGRVTRDPSDPKYRTLAEESLMKYLETSGNSKPHSVVRVEKVTVQMVAGKLTRIYFIVAPEVSDEESSKDIEIKCHSHIWEKSWIDFKEINVTCMDSKPKSRIARGAPIPGGQSEKDPSDARYKSLAEKSLKKFVQSSTGSQHFEVIRVNKVTTQVTSGLLTRIDFTISPTNCQLDNNQLPLQYNCLVQEHADEFTCHSQVWEQPWIPKEEITVNCDIKMLTRVKRSFEGSQYYDIENSATKRYQPSENNHKHKRNVRLGGTHVVDSNKKIYKKLAEESLRKYEILQNSNTHHVVIEVKHVTEQVVSGKIINVDFIASPTSCSVDVNHFSSCVPNENVVIYCHSRIWTQPWLGRKDIKISCRRKVMDSEEGNDEEGVTINGADDVKMIHKSKHTGHKKIVGAEHRNKRQIIDEEDMDEDMKYYYADRAVQQINDRSDTNNLQKLISIHAFQISTNMGANMIRMYIETAFTYCLRHEHDLELQKCDELGGMRHRLCLARLWPSPDDELVVQDVHVVCDDSSEFQGITGMSTDELITISLEELERSPTIKHKLVSQGEPYIIPTLDSNIPITMSFIVAFTNCTKDVDIDKRFECFIDTTIPSKACVSYMWTVPNSRNIQKVKVKCGPPQMKRKRRSVPFNSTDSDYAMINNMVQESLEKLEMASMHKYKQRLIEINSYSTKVSTAKVTTIDFDVGYTSCLKYEWIENITNCDFLEHLPRRHCVSHVYERLWVNNGRHIDINCEDDETPLEAHIEFENAENAIQLANEALKHIEAKYPNTRKQKVVRIFSLEKQVIAGIHYRMKIEVGSTNCLALSIEEGCEFEKDSSSNKFCRVNIWLRPWTDHPPIFRVSCDYQSGAASDLYRKVQAEHLFYNFIATYKPHYEDDHGEMIKRFKIFEENVRKIHELNIHERGTAKYAVTRFADLSYEEFTTKYLGLKPKMRDINQIPMRKAIIPEVSLPDKFDWREHNAVTEVKNQGSCGSCWAFSVTGNIEGQWKIKSGQLLSLSEQELVDCDKLDEGCNGGLPDNAYRSIEQMGGLETEDDYPYEGEDDKCAYNKSMTRVQITGAVNITSNETDMAKWLVQRGPISIGINANAMQFYVGGVSHPWKMLCNPNNLDHGVLIVGYGTKEYPLFHKKLPYWIVKNSWGPSWGEQGYYRVYRGDGTCGVNQMASSAIV